MPLSDVRVRRVDKVIFEGDSANVFLPLNYCSNVLAWTISPIINDIFVMLKQNNITYANLAKIC